MDPGLPNTSSEDAKPPDANMTAAGAALNANNSSTNSARQRNPSGNNGVRQIFLNDPNSRGGSPETQNNGARPKSRPRSATMRDTCPVENSQVFPRRLSIADIYPGDNRPPANRQPIDQPDAAQTFADPNETVLTSFMFERYRRDHTASDGSTSTLPRSASMSASTSMTDTYGTVGRKLATIGDEIDAKYHREFQSMAKCLNIQRGAFSYAYEAFAEVCQRLFEDSISWGRIIALLQFGYHLAVKVAGDGVIDFIRTIVKQLVKFIMVERIRHCYCTIAEWIAAQGGWQASIQELTHRLNQQLVALTAVAAMVLLGVYWFNRR